MDLWQLYERDQPPVCTCIRSETTRAVIVRDPRCTTCEQRG